MSAARVIDLAAWKREHRPEPEPVRDEHVSVAVGIVNGLAISSLFWLSLAAAVWRVKP